MYIDLNNISDFDVLAQIYEDTIINNEISHYRKLVQETGINKLIVSKNLDILSDLCMINSDFKQDKDKKYRICYTISDEAMFIAKARYEYNQLQGKKLEENNEVQLKRWFASFLFLQK